MNRAIDNWKTPTKYAWSGRKNAEENLNWARQAKAEPVIGVYYYDVGKMEREGYLDDKLSALNDFWLASTYGKVLAILGGAELQR